MWAYATANELNPKLFQKVADHIIAMDNLGHFHPQALANIVWSYATSNESNREFFNKIADRIIATYNINGFNALDLASIAWSPPSERGAS